MPTEKIEVQGKDVQEAIGKACKLLHVSQENLDIEVLTPGSSGIFGLCRKKARLLVARKPEAALPGATTPAATTPAATMPAATTPAAATAPAAAVAAPKKGGLKKERRPAVPAKPRARKTAAANEPAAPETIAAPGLGEAPDRQVVSRQEQNGGAGEQKAAEAGGSPLNPAAGEAIKEDLGRLLELMGCPSAVTISTEQDAVIASIAGPYDNEVVGPEGRTLDSLQYVLRKIANKKFPEKIMLSLDVGDFRAVRLKELEDLGRKLAEEVKETGKTRTIPALNPSERRIVHMALQDDKNIRSRSVGEGLFKKILIYRPGAKKPSPKKRK